MELNFCLPPKGFKRLFYDIETSPNIGLFWQPSYKAVVTYDNIIQERAIICICYKWEGQNTVHGLTWNEGCDKQLLIDFMLIMEDADECIAHNGDNFDEKWIRTRCIKHRISCSPKFNSLDTLKKARTHFRFNSNRLDYIGQFLTDSGKTETSYGLWKDILLKNCAESMQKMVDYCKRDVELLEEVYHVMRPYINHNTHAAVATDNMRWECPNCAGSLALRKTRVTKMGTIRRQMICNSCGSYHTISNKDYMSKLEDDKRSKNAIE